MFVPRMHRYLLQTISSTWIKYWHFSNSILSVKNYIPSSMLYASKPDCGHYWCVDLMAVLIGKLYVLNKSCCSISFAQCNAWISTEIWNEKKIKVRARLLLLLDSQPAVIQANEHSLYLISILTKFIARRLGNCLYFSIYCCGQLIVKLKV